MSNSLHKNHGICNSYVWFTTVPLAEPMGKSWNGDQLNSTHLHVSRKQILNIQISYSQSPFFCYLIWNLPKQLCNQINLRFPSYTNVHSLFLMIFIVWSCLTLCDPMDYSLPGSSVHGISRQEYWSGLPFPPPGDLSNPGIEPTSPALVSRLFTTEPSGKPGLDNTF